MQNASAAKSKVDTIIDNLTRLATAYNEPLTPDRIEIYTIALSNLTPAELGHGFNRALRETKWWPKPSELIEFCTGQASAMVDKLTIDEAWNWAVRYIEMFGIPGSTRWECQGHVYNASNLNGAIQSHASYAYTFAVSAPFYEVARYDIPLIPDLLEQTLIGTAGGVKMGLTRINDARRGWNGEEATTSKDAGFVRRDFDEYCSRAIAAAHIKSPTEIRPSHQLTGEVAPIFAAFVATRSAMRVTFNGSDNEVTPLTFEEAKQLFDAGKMPQHLYDEALSRQQELELRQKQCSIPLIFNAVYLGKWTPRPTFDQTPWPNMGRFNIENASGTMVILEDFPIAVGKREFKPGEVALFRATMNDLVFNEFTRTYFHPQ